ncbi:MAG TPA: AAA family ATPase [Polyangiaceae bacterium]|nr:AAA family ATPase [Polyangiaceae bacterium]
MNFLFAFQDFELDAALFELRRSGQRLPVQPKVLKLLLHLVVHRSRSVPVSELLVTLWPGESVGPASVKRAVKGARAALGESGTGVSAIRSVRGHGYQFVLAVRELRRAEVAAASIPTRADGMRDAFIGRQGVLSLVDSTLQEVLSGRGTSLLFVGEPGIGKTRTLRELQRRASALGVLTCLGRCSEVDGAPALWPVIQILRKVMATLAAGELRTLLGAGAADIAQAIPELRESLDDLPKAPEIDSVAARFRFFDSMASFVRRAAEEWPLAILIDDLQRADPPTLQLLAFLAREIEGSRVLLVAATRPVSDGANASPLAALATRTIELRGLGRGELGDFLRARLRSEPPADVLERLEHRTSGNPLFLEQILWDAPARCELCASLTSAPANGTRIEPCWHRFRVDAPGQGLRAAVDRHLQTLGEECSGMLRAAAVLGREFSLELLRDIRESPAERQLEWLEEAVSVGVLLPCSGSVSSYRFAHALIREALYEQLSLAERARLHWQAGLALEARGAGGSDALLSELAEHFVVGSAVHDRGRALHYTLRAAASARRCLAYEDAARHLGRALELLDANADPRQRMRVLLDQGELLKFAGRADAARESLLLAAGIARELGAHQELARAAAMLASAPEGGIVDHVRVDLLREALAALPPGDNQKPCLQALLAKSLTYSRDPESARIALAAFAAADRVLPLQVRAETLEACHEALAASSYLPERLSISDALTRIGHETGDQRILLRAAAARVWNCLELGDMGGVDAATASLETLVEHSREPFFRWHARAFRSMRAMIAGRLADAERLAHEAQALGSAIGETLAHHIHCAQLCGILRLQGRVSEVEPLVRDISHRHPTLGGWRAVLAQLEAELGRKEVARDSLQRLLEHDLDDLMRDPSMLSALAPAAELCAFVGNAGQARLLYDASLPYEHHHATVSVGVATYGPMARHLGMLAMRMGELACAEQHLERALLAAEHMSSPTFESLACIAYARLLLLRNDSAARERATGAVVRAFDLAQACGMHALARDCRKIAERGALPLVATVTQRNHSETIG